jgi:hypothetical protein
LNVTSTKRAQHYPVRNTGLIAAVFPGSVSTVYLPINETLLMSDARNKANLFSSLSIHLVLIRLTIDGRSFHNDQRIACNRFLINKKRMISKYGFDNFSRTWLQRQVLK